MAAENSTELKLAKIKHRHARRARVIFCELKGFGDSRIKSMTKCFIKQTTVI